MIFHSNIEGNFLIYVLLLSHFGTLSISLILYVLYLFSLMQQSFISPLSKGLVTKDNCTIAHDETHTDYVCWDYIFLNQQILLILTLWMWKTRCLLHFDFIVNHTILLIQYIPFELYRLTKINPAIFADESFSEDNYSLRSRLTVNVLSKERLLTAFKKNPSAILPYINRILWQIIFSVACFRNAQLNFFFF